MHVNRSCVTMLGFRQILVMCSSNDISAKRDAFSSPAVYSVFQTALHLFAHHRNVYQVSVVIKLSDDDHFWANVLRPVFTQSMRLTTLTYLSFSRRLNDQ